MKASLRRTSLTVGAAMALLLVGVAVPASASPQTDDIRGMTNVARVNAGPAPLKCSAALDTLAQQWSQQLANAYASNPSAGRQLSHNPNLSSQLPAGWSGWGENVAYVGGFADRPAQMTQAWIASPGHYANIVRPSATHIGVGYVVDGYGVAWGTQVFARYTGAPPDPTRVTVLGTFRKADLQPMAPGTPVVARTTNGPGVEGYVGRDGSFCVTVPAGNGTVDLLINNTVVDTLGGATAGATVSTNYVAPDAPPAPGTPGVVMSTPQRLVDVRNLVVDQPQCMTVTGRAGVPSNATGVIVNVTASQPGAGGNALVYPDSNGNGATPAPRASTVNFEVGRDVANSAFVALGPNGKLCYITRGSSPQRFIVDVAGYLTPESGVTLTASERVIDTRPGSARRGPIAGPIQPGTARNATLVGVAGVPASATAILANVTVTGVSGPGNLKVWPANLPRPRTSVVNYAPGQDKANFQIIGLSPSGQVSIETLAASTHVIIDVVGYLTDESLIVPVEPERIVETRQSSTVVGPLPGPLVAGTRYALPVGGFVPHGATGIVLNVIAVQPPTLGHLSVYPDSVGDGKTPPPNASTLNFIPGRDIPNSVVVQIPASGRVQIVSHSSRPHLVVDMVAYILPAPD